MEQLNQLIINTEFFLQCHGNCTGCFLNQEERKVNIIYLEKIKNGLLEISNKNINNKIANLIIGFGRGNLLSLSNEQLEKLGNLIQWCENNFNYTKITFEVSSSLIGKIEQQIIQAKTLLSYSKNIFFNIIVNSEITSFNFWKNFTFFYDSIANVRKNWGLIEDWGDILVLNVNPQKLPDLNFISKFVENYKSPININVFPFDLTQNQINSEEIISLNNWVSQLWIILKNKDFNIKNYLENLNTINFDLNPKDLLFYYKNTAVSYNFIDKNGNITKGIPSIMGEVDFPRLLEKYNIKPDIINAYKKMQKIKVCSSCEFQKECLVSGSFLNLLANYDRLLDNKNCPSGYKNLFKLSKN